jgi:hypothetical protein
MPTRTYIIVTRTNQRFQVDVDSEDTILQLAQRVSEVVGMNRDSFDLRPKTSIRFLSEFPTHSELQTIPSMNENDILYLYQRPNRWRYNVNTTSLRNQRKYHTRKLGESLERIYEPIRKQRERSALFEVGEYYKLPENLESHIAREYLGHPRGGKRKSRKVKKSKRQTRRR